MHLHAHRAIACLKLLLSCFHLRLAVPICGSSWAAFPSSGSFWLASGRYWPASSSSWFQPASESSRLLWQLQVALPSAAASRPLLVVSGSSGSHSGTCIALSALGRLVWQGAVAYHSMPKNGNQLFETGWQGVSRTMQETSRAGNATNH